MDRWLDGQMDVVKSGGGGGGVEAVKGTIFSVYVPPDSQGLCMSLCG